MSVLPATKRGGLGLAAFGAALVDRLAINAIFAVAFFVPFSALFLLLAFFAAVAHWSALINSLSRASDTLEAGLCLIT